MAPCATAQQPGARLLLWAAANCAAPPGHAPHAAPRVPSLPGDPASVRHQDQREGRGLCRLSPGNGWHQGPRAGRRPGSEIIRWIDAPLTPPAGVACALGLANSVGGGLLLETEICYNFRYVVQRRFGGSVSWTTRKMGLYSQYVPTTRMNTWISVFAPEECMERVQEVLALAPEQTWDGTPKKCHNLDIHLLFMRTASHNWLPYINHLDNEFADMVCTAPPVAVLPFMGGSSG